MIKNFKIILICILLVLSSLATKAPNKISLIYENRYKQASILFTTQELIIEVNSYIKFCAPTSTLDPVYFVEICDKYNIDIKLALAQGQLESYFGTKGKAKTTNSVFNVGTYDDGTVLYYYENPNLSIEPYAHLIRTRYMTDEKSEQDLLKKHGFKNTNGHRYASSRHYEKVLHKIIISIKEDTKIDSLLEKRKIYNNLDYIIDKKYLII